MQPVNEPICKPTLCEKVRATLRPEGTFKTMDVSQTQTVARPVDRGNAALGVVPCDPKYLPEAVTERQPVAGKLAVSIDET
jgi:hypothetical protein